MKYLVLLLTISSFAVFSQEPEELFWEDMIPKNYIAPQEEVNHDGSMVQQSLNAPVVNELDGNCLLYTSDAADE